MSEQFNNFGASKILAHPGECLEYLNGGQRTIIVLEIHMTNQCDGNCPNCSGCKKTSPNAHLDFHEAKNYIKQLKSFGAKAVIFSGGGDPLCHQETCKTISYAKSIGLDIGLFTNGIRLNEEYTDIKTLLDCCTFIRISLDAGDHKLYKKIHGNDRKVFEKVIANMKALMDFREAYGGKTVVGAGYLTGEGTATLSEMKKFLDVCCFCRIDFAHFRPFHWNFDSVKKELVYLRGRYKREKLKIFSSDQKYRVFNKKPIRNYKTCHGVNFVTVIAADANVYQCCHLLGNKDFSLGSLRDMSFQDIWANKFTIFDRIDVSKCVPFCRCDNINRQIEELLKMRGNLHINFL